MPLQPAQEHADGGRPLPRGERLARPPKTRADDGPPTVRTSWAAGATPAGIVELQGAIGNAATTHLLQRAPGSPAPAAGMTAPSPPVPLSASPGRRVAFVREEGLNLREGPEQGAASHAQLPLGTRVHLLDEETAQPGWQKVATPGAAVGFVSAARLHLPPADLIARDPALKMVRIRSGQTFWGLVKEQYGIQGNEGDADQNINHFINAIRAVNKSDAFMVKTDWLDDIGNWLVSGRDASDTLLKANYDLWIPSFPVAAAMDVGSGTVTGEVTRLVKKVEQKIEDFRNACSKAADYAPESIRRHAGDTAMGLLQGLIDFAIDAAKILAISTAAGALIGAFFGGVGAIPGAEIGFEIGLLILEFYGLGMLVATVLSMAGSLVSQLGSFVSQVWDANGDPKKIDAAGRTLADALGILVSALLLALAAYLMKKGGDALAKSKFAGKVGQTQIAQWLAERQRMTTTKEALAPKEGKAASTREKAAAGTQKGVEATPETVREGTVRMEEHPDYGTRLAELADQGFTIVKTAKDPHVVIRRVVAADGTVLRIEKEVHVQPGMRYLDFEHELGHVRQMTDPARFPEGPPPSEIKLEGGTRNAPNQSGVLTTRQNAVMEYHNRLQEVLWLEQRGASSTVMREHLAGIDGSLGVKGWRERYQDATRGGEKSSVTQWQREHFPDLQALELRVQAVRDRLAKETAGGSSGAGQPPK